MLNKLDSQPCIPTRGTEVPAGLDWFYEITHDGYHLIVQREQEGSPADPPRLRSDDVKLNGRVSLRCLNATTSFQDE